MSNEIEAFAGTSVGNLPSKEISSSLRSSSLDRKQTSRFVESLGGRDLLKYGSRPDKWSFGKDQESLEPGEDKMAVNPGSFVHGVCCWTGGNDSEFVDELMVPITDDKPLVPEDWASKGDVSKQYQFDLQVLDGEYKGVLLRFRSNSYGGVTSVQDLASKLADQLETENDGYYIPIIVLDSSTYTHKKNGILGNPIFKIVDWANSEGEMLSARKKVEKKKS